MSMKMRTEKLKIETLSSMRRRLLKLIDKPGRDASVNDDILRAFALVRKSADNAVYAVCDIKLSLLRNAEGRLLEDEAIRYHRVEIRDHLKELERKVDYLRPKSRCRIGVDLAFLYVFGISGFSEPDMSSKAIDAFVASGALISMISFISNVKNLEKQIKHLKNLLR